MHEITRLDTLDGHVIAQSLLFFFFLERRTHEYRSRVQLRVPVKLEPSVIKLGTLRDRSVHNK